MFKSKFKTIRLPASACVSALIGLTGFLLPTQKGWSQCVPGVGGGFSQRIQVSPGVAHVGDIITIENLVAKVDNGTCTVTNGVSYVMYPNGNTTVVTSGGNGINGVQIWAD